MRGNYIQAPELRPQYNMFIFFLQICNWSSAGLMFWFSDTNIVELCLFIKICLPSYSKVQNLSLVSVPLLFTVSWSTVPHPNYTIQTASVYQRGIWIPLKPNYSTLRNMKTLFISTMYRFTSIQQKSTFLSGPTGEVTSLFFPLHLRVPQKKKKKSPCSQNLTLNSWNSNE